jgi:hypothetical protein
MAESPEEGVVGDAGKITTNVEVAEKAGVAQESVFSMRLLMYAW